MVLDEEKRTEFWEAFEELKASFDFRSLFSYMGLHCLIQDNVDIEEKDLLFALMQTQRFGRRIQGLIEEVNNFQNDIINEYKKR